MGRGYEIVDCKFVVVEEGVDMLLIQDTRALGLGEDEVEEEKESEPSVEWDPRIRREVSRASHAIMQTDAYHARMKPAHDSKSNAQANTTQYISHGVNSAGSEVLRAL